MLAHTQLKYLVLRAQVAHHLEAPIEPWARAFWPLAVVDGAGDQLRPSVSALFGAAPPDVVEALCDAHPVLDSATRPLRPLLELLALLPPVAGAAACRAALTAWSGSCDASNGPFGIIIDDDSTSELCACAASQLQALGVRNVALDISACKPDQKLLRAVEPLLAQQITPGGMQILQLTMRGASIEEILVAVLPRCKAGLRSLRVQRRTVVLSSAIIEAIAVLHSLEHLVLPHLEPSGLPTEAVLATLPALPRLHSFSIRIGQSTTFWMGCISQMTALQALDIHLALAKITSSQLGDAIAHLRALTCLSLSGSLGFDSDSDDSEDEEADYASARPALQAILTRAPKLQHLDLSNMTLAGGQKHRPSDGALDICAAVAGAALASLTRLDLCASNVNLSFGEMQPVCAHLAALTRLRELHLSRNFVKDSGAARLATCMVEFTSLQSLGLSCCDIGPAGVAALAPALHQLANLTRLDLSDNSGVSAECAEQLAHELRMHAAGGVLSSLKRARMS